MNSKLFRVGAIALLWLFFVPLLHPYADWTGEHKHELEQQCSVQLEQDPCHLRLVHHDSSFTCEHDGHLSHHEPACEWCDLWLNHSPYQLERTLLRVVQSSETPQSNALNTPELAPFAHGISVRGPPIS